MPFREKLKKTFSRNSTSNQSGQTAAESGLSSNIYQPGEKIPYKYRRPVAQEHKEKLEAFSFADAWRRKSHQSQYSPMGSRLTSRRGSLASIVRRSMGDRRQNSNVGPMGEGGDDSSITDDGTTPVNSAPDSNKQPEHGRADSHKENEDPNPPSKSKDFAQANGGADLTKFDMPFSQEDLTLAMKRSHLEAAA